MPLEESGLGYRAAVDVGIGIPNPVPGAWPRRAASSATSGHTDLDERLDSAQRGEGIVAERLQ